MPTMQTAQDDAIPQPSPGPGDDHVRVPVLRVPTGEPPLRDMDDVAVEVPVALEYNGISHATVLASPTDLEDFVRGFSITEGIVRSVRDIYGTELAPHDRGLVMQVEIASACLQQLKLRRRQLAGRSGCGLCGLESLDDVARPLAPLAVRRAAVSAAAVSAAVAALRERQALHLRTGATHAAGWADIAGNIAFVREDVGRHNALDKLIGHLLERGLDPEAGFAVISSRASFEMVQKAAAAGIGALVAVSAPTSYAIQLAQNLNIMLAGFARDKRFTVYSHADYLI